MVDKLKLKNSALKIQIQKLDKQLGEKLVNACAVDWRPRPL